MTKSSAPSTVAKQQQPQQQQTISGKRQSTFKINTNIKDKKAKKEPNTISSNSLQLLKKTPTGPINKASKQNSAFPDTPCLRPTVEEQQQQQQSNNNTNCCNHNNNNNNSSKKKQILQTVHIDTATGQKTVVETEIDTSKDVQLLQRAIALSKEHMLAGHGGPFGAVIANSKTGEVLVDGWNVVTSTNDPTAHAEVTAVRRACQKLGQFQLYGYTAYSSCEPCPMCLAALYWARVDRVVFANDRKDAAKINFDDNLIYNEINIPPEKRTIPFHQIPLKEGIAVFDLWAKRSGKVAY